MVRQCLIGWSAKISNLQAVSVAVLALAISSLPIGAVRADTLAMFDGSLALAPSQGYSYVSLAIPDANGPAIFEDIYISTAAVGQTFTVSAANDPDFSDFVAAITDGVDQTITVYQLRGPGLSGGGGGIQALESSVQRFGSAGNPDLAGFNISSISMRINDFTTGEDDRVKATFFFEGAEQVPTPSSFAALVGMGLMGLIAVASRRRKQT